MSPRDRQESEFLASSGIDRTAGYLLAGLVFLLFIALTMLGMSKLELHEVRLNGPIEEAEPASPSEIGVLPETRLQATGE